MATGWFNTAAGRGPWIIAAGAVVLPLLIALALLSLWFLDAKQVETLSTQRRVALEAANEVAGELTTRTEAAASTLIAQGAGVFADDGAFSARGFYLGRSDVATMAIFDANGAQVFPDPQTLSTFSELTYLDQGRARLAQAQGDATDGRITWAGPLRDPTLPVIGCQRIASRAVCVYFLPEFFMDQAGDLRLYDLGAQALRAEVSRVHAVLPAPYAGFAVALDYDLQPAYGGWALVVLIGPAVLATLGALGLFVAAYRAHLQTAQARVASLAMVSHELRTPLANLRLYADMLPDAAGDAPRVARYGQVIAEEATRLGRIVDNALATETSAPALQTLSVDARLRDLLTRFGPSVVDHLNLTLDLNTPDVVRLDGTCVDQVVLNLLDNARKYAPGAAVRLCSARRADRIVIRVSDDGAQVPVAGAGGFGLGLRTCDGLARAAGGRFTYDITAQGSWFELSLPYERVA